MTNDVAFQRKFAPAVTGVDQMLFGGVNRGWMTVPEYRAEVAHRLDPLEAAKRQADLCRDACENFIHAELH